MSKLQPYVDCIFDFQMKPFQIALIGQLHVCVCSFIPGIHSRHILILTLNLCFCWVCARLTAADRDETFDNEMYESLAVAVQKYVQCAHVLHISPVLPLSSSLLRLISTTTRRNKPGFNIYIPPLHCCLWSYSAGQ